MFQPKTTFRDGFVAILPICVAAAPLSLVLGALAVDKGLSPLEVTLSSAIVFAGAAQFVAIELWEVPVPIASLALAAFLVNLRHVLMGIALAPHLPPGRPWLRAGLVFFMVDEVWAMSLQQAVRGKLTVAFYAGMGISIYLIWTGFTAIGALVGSFIGDPQRWGFDFAFVAIFLALVGGFWSGRKSLAIWSAAAFASCAAKLLIPGPWFVVVGGLTGMAMAAILWQPEDAARARASQHDSQSDNSP